MINYFKYKPIRVNQDGSLDEVTFSQVIEPIAQSYFYLPNRTQLNDPTEGVYINEIHQEINGFLTGLTAFGEIADLRRSFYVLLQQLEHSRSNSGIFSLSKTAEDELMWAYYANGHLGIAIEYNLDKLIRFAPPNNARVLEVNYLEQPNAVDIRILQENPNSAIDQMLGTKSKKWSHESELRVVVENMCGKMPHDYRAVESITFGLNVKPDIQAQIFEMTKAKVKHFYEMKVISNSFNFERVKLEQFEGRHPVGNNQNINFDGLLSGVADSKRETVINNINELVNNDPHFEELFHAEISTIDPTKIAVNYQVKHQMQLGPWAEFSKNKLPFNID
jgi:hypothetical protein